MSLEPIDTFKMASRPTGSQLRLQPVGSFASYAWLTPFITGQRVIVPSRSKVESRDMLSLTKGLTPITFESSLMALVNDVDDAIRVADKDQQATSKNEDWDSALNSLRAHLRVGPAAFRELSATEFATPSGSQGVFGSEFAASRRRDEMSDWFRIRPSPAGFTDKGESYATTDLQTAVLPVGSTRVVAVDGSIEAQSWYQDGLDTDDSDPMSISVGLYNYLTNTESASVDGGKGFLGLLYSMSYWEMFTNLHRMAKRDFSDPTMLGFLAENDLKRGTLPKFAERLYMFAHLAGFCYAPILAYWRILDTLFDIPEYVSGVRRAQNPSDFDQFRAHAMALRNLPLPQNLGTVVAHAIPRNGTHLLTPLHATATAALFGSSRVVERSRTYAIAGTTTFPSVQSPKIFEEYASNNNDLKPFYRLTALLHDILIPSNQGAMDTGYLYSKSASLFGFAALPSAIGNTPVKVVADGISFEGDVSTFADALLSDPIPAVIASGPLALVTARSGYTELPPNIEILLSESYRMAIPRRVDETTVTRTNARTGADILDFRGMSFEPYPLTEVTWNPRFEAVMRPSYEFPNAETSWCVETGLSPQDLRQWFGKLLDLQDPLISHIVGTFWDGSSYIDSVAVTRGVEARELNLCVRYETLGGVKIQIGSGSETPSHPSHLIQLAGDRIVSVTDLGARVYARTSSPERPKKLFSSLR